VIGRWFGAAGRKRQWRPEFGSAHDLRLYEDGRPTPVVAATGWDHGERVGGRVAHGPQVMLYRETGRIVLVEQRPGYRAVRMQLPLASCVDASLTESPGLPGMALVGLVLSTRVGESGTCQLSLWFHTTARALLQELVDDIAATPAVPPARPTLPPLAVRLAPDEEDWVVFRSADDGVIVPRELEERP
jgi:hypothetical protein